tara:strand:- start:1621 stop:2364 length:744 start_codon:yes stop_codon:yes gene_type:complete
MQFIINKHSIFVSNNGESYTLDSTYPSFDKIKDFIKLGSWFEAKRLIDIGNAITEFGGGVITVQRGVVKFKDYVVDNSLTKRIVKMVAEEIDSTPIINFLLNLMENPDKRAVDETYGFLDHNDLPITPDGCFMAYKNVNKDYLDKHSRTFSNKIGDICEMPRNRVCSDKNRTCSDGLHFCSLEYLQGFWGTDGHTMLIKINPRDVVSIPIDYKGAKGRCSRYEVVAEADFSDGVTEIFTETVYNEEN